MNDSSFILQVVALEFGVCMYYFSNKILAKFARKNIKFGFSMIYYVLENIVKKSSEKTKPSPLTIMILQYRKNLWLKLFFHHNDVDNFKILWLFL